MFNLIRRDVILQKKQLFTFIPLIFFFIIMDIHPVLTYLIASLIIPFNTYVYDEKVETNILLNSLPYTRMEIIASRYLGAIVYMISAIGLTSIAFLAFNKPFTMADILMGSGLFLIFASITFPLFYIFKPGYIFPGVIIGFLLLGSVGPAIVLNVAERLTAVTDIIGSLSMLSLYIVAILIILILYVSSWMITSVIYQRKAF